MTNSEISLHESISRKAKKVQPLREIVVESLREAIVTGQLKPGEHLIERDLSEQLGISTTPIKEAFRILGNEGLVVTVPRKGTYVSELAEVNIMEILMLRSVIEGLCAKFAAAKINKEQIDELEKQIELMQTLYYKKDADNLVEENTHFHSMIRDIAGNPIITNIHLNVSSLEKAFRKRALQEVREIEEGYSEHRNIFAAIKAKDGDLAESLMKKHITRTSVDVLNT